MYNIKTTGDTIYNLPDWQCLSTSSFGEGYEQREYAHSAGDSKIGVMIWERSLE